MNIIFSQDLCHSHVQESIIRNKIQTIVDVFIKSIVPPELQIDIPIEISERLLEKACGKNPQHGPYLFREAQVSITRFFIYIMLNIHLFCKNSFIIGIFRGGEGAV